MLVIAQNGKLEIERDLGRFSVLIISLICRGGAVVSSSANPVMGFSDNGYLNAVLLLLLAPIVACMRLFTFNKHDIKSTIFCVLPSATNIYFCRKSRRIRTHINNCYIVVTFLLTQMVIQSQVFGLVGFHCTHNECACVCLCGIVTAKYNTDMCIDENSETSYFMVLLHWIHSSYPHSESSSLSLFHIFKKKTQTLYGFQGRCLSPQ